MPNETNIASLISSRNALLLKHFQHFLPNRNIRITGNPNAPAVIIDNKWVANCYVHNFNLYHTDGQKDGQIIFEHKMSTTKEDNFGDADQFHQWFKTYKMNRCYIIKAKGSILFYTGHNYLETSNGDRGFKYPVFAEYDPKIFYTKTYASRIIKEINSGGLVLTTEMEVE